MHYLNNNDITIMKNIHEWNNEYAIYHKNKTNKIIHWFCIPLIMYSLFGILSQLSFSFTLNDNNYTINILVIFIVLATLYYFKLSKKLAIGMLIVTILLVKLLDIIDIFNSELHLIIYLSIFSIAWVGQFLGHKIEGKKPAFFKDLQFLLIGPLWLLSYIYKRLRIKF